MGEVCAPDGGRVVWVDRERNCVDVESGQSTGHGYQLDGAKVHYWNSQCVNLLCRLHFRNSPVGVLVGEECAPGGGRVVWVDTERNCDDVERNCDDVELG